MNNLLYRLFVGTNVDGVKTVLSRDQVEANVLEAFKEFGFGGVTLLWGKGVWRDQSEETCIAEFWGGLDDRRNIQRVAETLEHTCRQKSVPVYLLNQIPVRLP